MDIFVICPSCRRELLLPERMLHKYVRCPECRSAFFAERRALTEPYTTGRPQGSYFPQPETSLPSRVAEDARWPHGKPIRTPRRVPWYFWIFCGTPIPLVTLFDGMGPCLLLSVGAAGLLCVVVAVAPWSSRTRLLALLTLNAVFAGLMIWAASLAYERARSLREKGEWDGLQPRHMVMPP
jgi:DNA-directed RNA polymerase subunit RPC12/RpoP